MTRLRAVMLGLAMFLPLLSLVPLGSLWLWQNGFVLHWVAAALVMTGVLYSLELRALPPPRLQPKAISPATGLGTTSRETAARVAVAQLADNIDPAKLQSRDDLLALAGRTIETVAREIHPNDKAPVWNFTIPEMLLLTERVSAQLRPIVIDTLPLGEQMTVGQALQLYEWRSAVGVVNKMYDIWRLLRLFNPAAAVTQEARERLTQHIIVSVRDDLTKRIVRRFVLEIGSAAIDLYGGRLRDLPIVDPRQPVEPVEPTKSTRWSRIWREARKISTTAARLYGRKS